MIKCDNHGDLCSSSSTVHFENFHYVTIVTAYVLNHSIIN